LQTGKGIKDMNMQEHRIYYEAILNPLKVEEADLLRLIDRYPYSQPLRYALLRKKILLGQDTLPIEDTLLYAPNSSWLWNYVHIPVHTVEEIQPEQEEYVRFEEYEQPIAVQDTEEEPHDLQDGKQPVDQEEVVSESIDTLASEEDAAIEKLVQEGSIVGDYFVFEQKENNTSDDESVEEEQPEEAEEENVSLYNDDMMPYSFRWWLYKTRLQHADTYQPYATPVWPPVQKGQFDPKKLDEAILDQQIKESIIHFQDPEMKLSEEVKRRPVEAVEPKKGSEIIEKFIQEEPIIHPPSPEQLNTENMARQSAEDNYMLVTETLANIYVDQGLYLKAIEVFKKLILRYPEKKSYFAAQIQNLEKNI